MKRHRRINMHLVAMVLFLMTAVGTVGLTEELAQFSIEVEEAQRSSLLGMNVVLDLEIRNISAVEQNLPKYSAMLRLDLIDAPRAAEPWLGPDEHIGKDRRFLMSEECLSVPAGWTKRIRRGFVPPVAGDFKVMAVLTFRESGRSETLAGESPDHWVGEAVSNVVDVKVHEPEGLDAKAFREIGNLAPENKEISPARRYSTAFWPGTTEALDLLLGKYIKSGYAAEKIYRVFADVRVTASMESYLRYMQHSGTEGPPGEGDTWCNSNFEPRLTRNESVRLRGEDLIRCRDRWLEIALTHHPDIWFADEMRLKLALDRYMLGDKDACSAGLEALSEHGRPYVAEKARGLLEAMQSKGMLPGGSDDVPEAPHKPEPCEPADR